MTLADAWSGVLGQFPELVGDRCASPDGEVHQHLGAKRLPRLNPAAESGGQSAGKPRRTRSPRTGVDERVNQERDLSVLSERVMWRARSRPIAGSRYARLAGIADEIRHQIREEVIQELRWDPQVTDPDVIGVAVKDGAVTLTGAVSAYAQKFAAVHAAARVYGVKALAEAKIDARHISVAVSDHTARLYGHVHPLSEATPQGQRPRQRQALPA